MFIQAIVSTILALTSAQAEILTPTIEGGRFDTKGRLSIIITKIPPTGCSLALWGGVSSKSIDTLITARKINDADSVRTSITIRTRRKYYCKERTLYVRIISECYPEAAPSKVVRVSVPAENILK